MVAKRDHIHPGGEHLVCDLRSYPQAARGVLAVDHDERRLQPLGEDRQALQQRSAADAADHVAHEEDARGAVGRLVLRHTLPMAGGK